MEARKLYLPVALLLLLFISVVAAQGNSAAAAKPKKAPYDAASTNYDLLSPLPKSGQERVFCKARGKCRYKTMTCPEECPERKPKKNKKKRGCFVDCSSKCEVTCKCKHRPLRNFSRTVGRRSFFFFFLPSEFLTVVFLSDREKA